MWLAHEVPCPKQKKSLARGERTEALIACCWPVLWHHSTQGKLDSAIELSSTTITSGCRVCQAAGGGKCWNHYRRITFV